MKQLSRYGPENPLRIQDVDIATLLTIPETARSLDIHRGLVYEFCKNYRQGKGLWKIPHVLVGESKIPFVPRFIVEEFRMAYEPNPGKKAPRRKRHEQEEGEVILG